MSSQSPLASDIIVIDVGNTHLRAELVVGGEHQENCNWDYVDPHFFKAWLLAMAVNCQQRYGSQPPIYVASVQPKHCSDVQQAAADAGFVDVHVAAWNDPWPFAIDVESPQTLGMDRLANVAGLVALGIHRGVAVDLGTAITIDVLDEGHFRGGLIAPGLSLQAQVLRDHTAALPQVDPSKEVARLGRTTEEAIISGITNIALEGAATMARTFAAQIGADASIVCTGGWGERLLGRLPGMRHEPGLTFLGLRALAARCA